MLWNVGPNNWGGLNFWTVFLWIRWCWSLEKNDSFNFDWQPINTFFNKKNLGPVGGIVFELSSPLKKSFWSILLFFGFDFKDSRNMYCAQRQTGWKSGRRGPLCFFKKILIWCYKQFQGDALFFNIAAFLLTSFKTIFLERGQGLYPLPYTLIPHWAYMIRQITIPQYCPDGVWYPPLVLSSFAPTVLAT